MKTHLSSTSEQVGRWTAPKDEVRPVPPVAPIGRLHDGEAVFVGQWQADTPRAVLLYLFEPGCLVWIPWTMFRSDDVQMPGEAGRFVASARWMQRKLDVYA
jgi:hypothetical protein